VRDFDCYTFSMSLRKLTSLFLGAVIIGVVFVAIPWLFVYLNNYFQLPIISTPIFKIIGAVLICICLGIVFYSVLLHVNTGRFTPLPFIEHPQKFIYTGLYRYCRNPMYLTEIFLLFGVFFVFGHLLLLLYPFLFFLKVHFLVVFFEEPELRKTFGESYLKYQNTVPRWLPKL